MTELVLRGGQVLGDQGWGSTDLAVRDGVLVETAGDDAEALDVSGFRVVPGYIDLQCNGGFGIDLAREPERLWELGALLPRTGVTAWLPTIVTNGNDAVERALETLRSGPPTDWRGAVSLGLHLEGPFLSPAKRGAHPEQLLRPPTLEAIDGWSGDGGVALVTIAPDLPGALEVIAELASRGVVVSLGHTPATFAEATAGVDAGARWVTHLFNAMSPLHHREPGLPGVALGDDRLHVGLIPDGVHVHPAVVRAAARALGDRLTIVTDAVSVLGLDDGTYGPVTLADGEVRLADGTLAGSALAMDQGVRNLRAFADVAPEAAVQAASTAPAMLLDDDARGALVTGRRADLLVLTDDLHLVTTVVAGEVVHDARWSR